MSARIDSLRFQILTSAVTPATFGELANRLYISSNAFGSGFRMYMSNVSADISPVPKALAILLVCLLQSPKLRMRAASLMRRKTA